METTQNTSNNNAGCLVVMGIVIALFVALLSTCGGGGSSSSSSKSRSAECHICGRTYTDSSNVRSIRNTNMCNKCYRDYLTLQEMQNSVGNMIPLFSSRNQAAYTSTFLLLPSKLHRILLIAEPRADVLAYGLA